jgi:hypothetical protein
MAERQCARFLADEVRPLLLENRESLGVSAEIGV